MFRPFIRAVFRPYHNTWSVVNNFRSWPEDGPNKGPKHVTNLTSKKCCVLTKYLRVSFWFQLNLNFPIDFIKIHTCQVSWKSVQEQPSCSDRQERHDEANSRFSQTCQRAYQDMFECAFVHHKSHTQSWGWNRDLRCEGPATADWATARSSAVQDVVCYNQRSFREIYGSWWQARCA